MNKPKEILWCPDGEKCYPFGDDGLQELCDYNFLPEPNGMIINGFFVFYLN